MASTKKPPALRFVAALGLLLIGCLVGCAGEPRRRVFVLGLDGFDPEIAGLLAGEGKLPNLDRLRREGAYGRLRSQPPLLSPVVWTTIATGKTPDVHGIGDFVAVGPDGGRLPVTSDLRRVKAVWNIASQAHRRVAVVGWWATWPPEPVDGVVVSDHTAYHVLFPEAFSTGDAGRGETTTYPPELAAEIAPQVKRPGDVGAAELAPFVQVTAEELARPFLFDNDLAHFRWALATAMSYRDVGLALWRRERPDLELVYIEATDSTAHLFGHLFRTEGLAGELAAQQAKYGGAVEAIYRFADSVVGEVLAALDDRSTLVVLSDHGFRVGVLPEDPTTTRDTRRFTERFHREEGVIYLYGAGVRRGVALERPTILDVTPTLLALLGLPAAADMPGRVLAEGLVGPPPERVASYEDGSTSGGEGPVRTPRDEAVDAAQLAHLRSLGYLGGSGAHPTSQSDRTVAATHFEKGDYAEAARIFSRLVAAEPDDAALRSSLAGALGELGRLDEARAQLERAIELQPLVPESYYNLAVVAERQGDPERAVSLYRTALRYAPDYRPARQALVRLTGSAEGGGPKTAAERQADRLAEKAAAAARRSAYPEAMRLLDAAEAAAPRYALVQQYRSNVAYLMGDRERAIAALEKGLAIEPDNALFRENLERLRAEAAAVTPRPAPAL